MRPTVAVVLVVVALPLALRADDDPLAFFEKEVRPILATHCYQCHSRRVSEPKGGLQLDDRDKLFGGSDSGEVISPGNPDQSLLMQAVRYSSDALKMPPDKQLSRAQIGILEAWIKRGAPMPSAEQEKRRAASEIPWAFIAPSRPHIPPAHDPNWTQNPIDNFILAKLDEKQLAPAPPADKRAFL